MKRVRYMLESHNIVAGPKEASWMTDDKFGVPPVDMEVDEMDFPAYLPTAAESTRLNKGSDTHIRKVVATKNVILL